MNQQIEFLSDGGDTVRDLQLYLSPEAEHLLDWFPITMRLTTLTQTAKGLPATTSLEGRTLRDDVLRELERIKWFLWHGNVEHNGGCIPNYGERYRNGERISTGFVESTVNYVVSKRMVQKQQMRWSQRGAHLLLQIRTRVLNGDWEETCRQWYPGFRAHTIPVAA
jgi:hypothetical protein